MKAPDSRFLLPVLLILSPVRATAHPASRHIHQTAKPAKKPASVHPSDGQKALARAQAARRALEKRQADEAAKLHAKQLASAQAETKARQDSARTRAFTTQTHTAQSAVDTTRTRITALRTSIAELMDRQASVEADIKRQNAALQPLLPIAARLSIAPDVALLASPETASESVTALSILGGFSRLTRQRAQTLQSREDELQTISAKLKDRQSKLADLLAQQTLERNAAAARTRVAARKEAVAEQDAEQARKAVAEATQSAAELSSEIEGLVRQEAQARAQLEKEAAALIRQHQLERARHVRSQASALTSTGDGVSTTGSHAPVSGHIAIRWGQTTEAGPSTGITYVAVPSSSVQAPCTGRVEFAAPFRSFGQMLILNCGRNYRFVLSGLGQLSVSGGESIRKAATLGQMPPTSAMLFVQLRHGTQVISPAPFL
ncbi:murein hydrolase activator EnvC family protein [Gluconobacter kanchanaburiensis]|uniref:Membrane protein n=1 Tax=Gluconobacter kanchanaburiensis NBRC 103587 TaxID=1307948 RepID=A0A511B5R6_9PROT|nr:peptidoglycan DD-metalloendopeptidase family protein [Gluconobacter kanchanaburiensis]MBF0861414.1 peptidoglycan DD-metalloendopeptidase family protein [Gluconobacter kanchanaburiensis]GEK95776.1 membrane protein [Gluconobacter kanchanaburiensis NBRC 103587]